MSQYLKILVSDKYQPGECEWYGKFYCNGEVEFDNFETLSYPVAGDFMFCQGGGGPEQVVVQCHL